MLNGIRILISFRRDANGQVILNQLYKNTQLQDTCAINMLALVKGEPKVLSLPMILDAYIEHQEDNANGTAKYNAWVAVGDADIRMLAQSGNVDTKKTPSLEQAILDDLNNSNAFYLNLATICRVYEQFATVRN